MLKKYILVQKYFADLTTTCILWHKNFDTILESSINTNVLLIINPDKIKESFSHDIYNFSKQDEYFNGNQIYYDDLVKKFVAAIENTNCEVYGF